MTVIDEIQEKGIFEALDESDVSEEVYCDYIQCCLQGKDIEKVKEQIKKRVLPEKVEDYGYAHIAKLIVLNHKIEIFLNT